MMPLAANTITLFLALALCGCVGGAPLVSHELRFRFVLDRATPLQIRAEESSSLPLDYTRVYELHPKDGIVQVPKGFLSARAPIGCSISSIVDTKGRLLSVGGNSTPGTFGFLGMVTRMDPNDLSKDPDGITQYFRFGTIPPSPSINPSVHTFRIEPTLRLEMTVDPGFQGRVEAVEDPALQLDFRRVYELRAIKGVVRVPKGFLEGSKAGGAYPYEFVELRDSTGRVLSKGMKPPLGKIAVRSLSVEVAKAGAKRRYFFEVWSGVGVPPY